MCSFTTQAAAQRGVTVRMITDWFGTGHKPAYRLQAEVTAAGVEHRIFNPWFRRGVTRTHRKICVVDGQVAFVGGININDDMFTDYEDRGLTFARLARDTDGRP